MSAMEEIVVEQVCQDCGKVRTNEPDYTPIQAMLGQPLGWYSGSDDGDFCPDHFAELMNLSNQMTNNRHKYRGWSSDD